MTGRNQPGVGMGRKLGLGMRALSEQLFLKFFENFTLAQLEGCCNFLQLCRSGLGCAGLPFVN